MPSDYVGVIDSMHPVITLVCTLIIQIYTVANYQFFFGSVLTKDIDVTLFFVVKEWHIFTWI